MITTKQDLEQLQSKELFALAVYLEAASESEQGQFAVAEVIFNRASKQLSNVKSVILKPFQFSFANETESGVLDSNVQKNIKRFYADEQEYFEKLVDDFLKKNTNYTNNATHYLNVELTKKIRNGTLPKWFYELQDTVKIGKHTFGKLGLAATIVKNAEEITKQATEVVKDAAKVVEKKKEISLIVLVVVVVVLYFLIKKRV